MNSLPITLQLTGKPCLVIGDPALARRKLTMLTRANAQVDFVGDNPMEAQDAESLQGIVGLKLLTDLPEALSPYLLVVLATREQHLIDRVLDKVASYHLPVNVFERPDLSTFTFPYLIDREPVSIAVSSSGISAGLTRLIQGRINALIPGEFGRLARFCGDFQQAVRERLTGRQDRQRFWESVMEGTIAERVYQGDEETARHLLQKKLAAVDAHQAGEVYLIGAGPGDPDLLTFKALRLLQSADVVLYDRLVNESLLALTREDALKIYVGKAKSDHAVPQSEINQWLIDYAREGKRVARLKGGDPFIFGRGGEEIEGLAEAAIPFQVIPGITAANGCSSYAGIPLTHRDFAQSVRFVTGHLKAGELDLDWPSLVTGNQTLVFYMGLSNLPLICDKLITHGLPETMPVALVEKGTTTAQRVLVSTLKQMPETLRDKSIEGPALTIVGEVVKLREKLGWFLKE